MSNVPISDWRSRVRDDIPNVNVNVVDRFVLDACIEFCERTSIWKERIEKFHVIAGVAEYEIPVPREAVLVTLFEFKCDNKPLDPETSDVLDRYDPAWEEKTGTPTKYTMLDSDTARLVAIPIESKSFALSGGISLKPSRFATKVTPRLFENWVEAITHGAKARLFGMKNEIWGDVAREKRHLEMFETQINRAISIAAKGHTRRARKRVTKHYF